MHVRVRLGAGLARLAAAPLVSLDLPEGATVADVIEHVGAAHPELRPALRSALPVVGGQHVAGADRLGPGDEVALLTPVAGG